ncbi:N-formylglutamate amidohydrolase [Brucepastera parasyntrophica]|uniref:N-formylglutamate amidohydrolase n=1 Tax=Brucepastera parasyntrophica TaxID=2880008 RepID=UPI00210D3BF3|nr:N-formylglutamate amidohydrolase [Brucepastera parasyntrophica]
MLETHPFSKDLREAVIVHIPHSGNTFPFGKESYDKDLLENEINLSTDWHTDKIFASELTTLCSGISRLCMDVERFYPVDEMDSYGRGIIYTKKQ